MCMGKDVTVHSILIKFYSVFGSVDRGQLLLSAFYSAKQETIEDVNTCTFVSRLQDLLSKADDAGNVQYTETNVCFVLLCTLN